MTELEPLELAVHRLKVQAHRALRWFDDRRSPVVPARASRLLIGLPRVAEDRSPLWNRDVDPREWPLELGKVENLRVAARALDGLELEADQVFSFWAQVGPPLRVRGFVPGRELREGCVIPGIGGGLCLLSNALFAAAKQAGLTIVERHPHSRRPPGSRAALGEDATVAWNYVDLRFVGDAPWRVQFPVQAVLRSLRSRQLASQGAARQRALLDDERRLARAMAQTLTLEDTELIVAQNLLPHLRRLGVLGGRRVTVLMQRLPLVELQGQLDRAHARWPQSPTLADFRADARLLEDEARGLEMAVEIVTPHAAIAQCFAGKVTKLDWVLPPRSARSLRPRETGPLRLWLPASTVGRKGVWELREALREVGPCSLWVAGRELEGPGFWPAQLHVERGVPELDRIDGVVLPAWVEHQPRELLRAVAAEVPVIASRACGLDGLAGVRVVETGDIAELREAIAELRGAIESDHAAAVG